jgi:hypothetical protein
VVQGGVDAGQVVAWSGTCDMNVLAGIVFSGLSSLAIDDVTDLERLQARPG